MSNSRQTAEAGVLVRFWTLDHHRGERVDGPPTPWPTLVYAEAGALFVELDDRKWALPADRALVVGAGVRFTMRTLAPARVRSLYFGPDFPLPKASGLVEVTPLFRELIVAACRRGPLLASREEHRALTVLLRVELEAASSLPTGLPWPRSEWLRRFASEALDGDGPVDEALAKTGYSRRTLERAMAEETRLSLGRWLRQARLLKAVVALGEGCSVADAAAVAGYSEPSAFIHAFRRAYGTTPGALRR